MKFKSLLLVGLSGFALASCGGMKDYKTEVKKETFASDIKKVFESSPLFSVEKPYSYVIEIESEFEETVELIKNNRTYVEEIDNSASYLKDKYDSVSNIVATEVYGEHFEKNNREKRDYKYDYDLITQSDSKNLYRIDMGGKVYEAQERADGAEFLKARAMADINFAHEMFFDEFLGILTFDDAKFFEDKNVFTVESVIEETEKGVSGFIKSVYQFVVNDDGYEFYYSVHREKTELNEKLLIDSLDKKIFKKSDDLKVNVVDLHDYLEVDEIEEIVPTIA